MFNNLYPEEETPPQAWPWPFGPGHLGSAVGIIVAGTGLGLLFTMTDELPFDKMMVSTSLVILLAGYFGGGLGGVTARDEFLREEWADHRGLVGLINGGLVALFFSWWLFQLWLILAAVAAGAVGGLVDAVIHRDHLEAGD